MASAYEDLLKSLPAENRSAEQQSLYDYSLGQLKNSGIGSADPYVQQILSAYNPTPNVPTDGELETKAVSIALSPKVPNFTEYATSKGLNPVFTPQNAGQATVSINGQNINPQGAGLTLNEQGHWTGTQEQYDALLQPHLASQTNAQPQQDQFKSQYDQSVSQQMESLANYPEYQENPEYKQLITDMLRSLDPNFEYSADTDESLIQAQKEVDRIIKETMIARGALYSDTTASLVVQEMGKLVPQFRQQALSEWSTTEQNKLNIVNTVEKLLSDEYMRYTDKYERQSNFLQITANLRGQEFTEFQAALDEGWRKKDDARQNELLALQKKSQEFRQAMERVNTLGYVDNFASTILGLPVGTETYAAKQAAIKRQQEIEDRERAIAVQALRDKEAREQDMKVLAAKAKYDKEQAARNYQYDVSKIKLNAKLSGGGSGSQKAYYNQALAKLTSAASNPKGSNSAFIDVIYHQEDVINAFGADYGRKLIEESQALYTQKVENNMANVDPSRVLKLISGGGSVSVDGKSFVDPQYYQKMMGKNYSQYIKYLSNQKSSSASILGGYYGG